MVCVFDSIHSSVRPTLEIEQAAQTLWRLREADDVSQMLPSLEGNMNGQYQPSTIETARSVSPTSFLRLQFELQMRH
jgi:hypothetical protein